MNRLTPTLTLALLATLTPLLHAASPGVAQKLYDETTPSLVGVQYTWESELGKREMVGAGTVITADGVIMTTLNLVHPGIPDEQLKEFKIIVPRADADNEELDATFLGRDERSKLAFVKVNEKRDWKPIKFADVDVKIGDPVYSVGLLPKGAGYRSYFMESAVAAKLRGEMPTVMVTGGGLCGVGSPVFNADGVAIGIVEDEGQQMPVLNDPRTQMQSVQNAPLFFVRAPFFSQSFAELPEAGEPLKIPWLGVMSMQGLKKDVAEFFGLKDQPAVEIGDVIAEGPAAKAGLKKGDVVVKINGQPIERGDEPEELGAILRRQMIWMKPGADVTLSVLSAGDKSQRDVKVTLGELPPRPSTAKRFYAEDLGFSVRELTFTDRYVRKLDKDAGGVLVAMIRPNSSAQTGKLEREDLVLELNGQKVTDTAHFKQAYETFRKDKPKEALVMEIKRTSNTQVIRIEPPQ